MLFIFIIIQCHNEKNWINSVESDLYDTNMLEDITLKASIIWNKYSEVAVYDRAYFLGVNRQGVQLHRISHSAVLIKKM